MQARFPKAHRVIETMHRERGIHVVYLVSRLANIFHRRKQYLLVIKGSYNKFFYSSSHILYNSKVKSLNQKFYKPVITTISTPDPRELVVSVVYFRDIEFLRVLFLQFGHLRLIAFPACFQY